MASAWDPLPKRNEFALQAARSVFTNTARRWWGSGPLTRSLSVCGSKSNMLRREPMSLDEKLEILRREDASEDALCDAIHDLGEEGPPTLHPHVAPFLAHPSPLVRDRK